VLAPTSPGSPSPPDAPPSDRSHRGDRRRRRRRIRRVVFLVLLVLLIPVGWSYAQALRAPGSAPASVRTVEWFKDHGGAGLVVWVERVWYEHHQPPVGGTPSGGIPVAAAQGSGAPPPRQVPPHLHPPAPVTPIAGSPLANEGVWQAVGRGVDGVPAVRVTYLRPDRVHTSLLAGVMWLDTKLLRPVLVPGTQVPGNGSSVLNYQVPGWAYPSLAATFNSGFLLKDAKGGFYLDGTTAAPLVKGQASFVIYKDGTADIGTWGSEVTMGSRVQAVRQNLWLLVDHAKPNPSLANDPNVTWGATFGGGVLVWRSGVGITKDGALVYVAGPGLSATSLADLLIHAGAVRAMELDINTVWTNGYFYSTDATLPSGLAPHPLLANQYRPPTRYLAPDERDFFMMLVRAGAGKTTG
jgi:hypothetical protein